jgi:Protein of unknown function (DUF4013)
MRLDVMENIKSPFSDSDWLMKILKVSLCNILLITSPAVAGYQMEVIRGAARGEDDNLPEFGPNFGSMWAKGLVVLLVLGGLTLVPLALIFGTFVSFSFLLADHGGLIAMLLLLTVAITVLFALCLSIPMPALVLNYVMTGDVSRLWNLREAVDIIKRGTTDYAVIVCLPLAASFASGFIGATGIGAILSIPIFTMAWIIQGRMLGKFHKAYMQ